MVKQLQSGSSIAKRSSELSRTPENKERIALLGEYLYKYAAIANRPIDEELIAIYAEALRGLSTSRLEAGLIEWLQEGDRWPWPSDLLEAAEL